MGWTEPQLSANPPPYDPEHPYKDPVALLEERERRSFRKEVEVEKAKIIREKLRECYMREGVNHFQKCKPWVDQYLERIKGVGNYRGNSGQFDQPVQ